MKREYHTKSFMEKLRDSRVTTLELRAQGHDIGYTKDSELYAMFPELTAMEVAAESSFLVLQSSGETPSPLSC